jgi:hypothetical protein
MQKGLIALIVVASGITATLAYMIYDLKQIDKEESEGINLSRSSNTSSEEYDDGDDNGYDDEERYSTNSQNDPYAFKGGSRRNRKSRKGKKSRKHNKKTRIKSQKNKKVKSLKVFK